MENIKNCLKILSLRPIRTLLERDSISTQLVKDISGFSHGLGWGSVTGRHVRLIMNTQLGVGGGSWTDAQNEPYSSLRPHSNKLT